MLCIIDCGSSYISNLMQITQELGDSAKTIPLGDISHTNMSEFSHIIISGSPALITKIDTQAYIDQFAFIKDSNIPILGICNGHQVIGLLYGAQISMGPKVNKIENISILKEGDLFRGVENNSLFQEEHCEYITLPKDFTLLATSASGENEAMQHTYKAIFGVQFHPEASGEPGKQVIKNFLEYAKE